MTYRAFWQGEDWGIWIAYSSLDYIALYHAPGGDKVVETLVNNFRKGEFESMS